MNRWLASECRWAREQALEADQMLDKLRTPAELEGLRRLAKRVLAKARADYAAAVSAASVKVYELSDAGLPDRIARLEKDRHYWTQLADEQAARLATEDEPMFEETTDDP